METIIGILGAIAVLIFKVIEKKMKDSALSESKTESEPMRQYRTLEDVFPEVNYDYVEDAPEPKVVQVEIPKEVEPTAEKKEKIDPKKLIVYSEIMNRKY